MLGGDDALVPAISSSRNPSIRSAAGFHWTIVPSASQPANASCMPPMTARHPW